jgi:hypothetical protein
MAGLTSGTAVNHMLEASKKRKHTESTDQATKRQKLISSYFTVKPNQDIGVSAASVHKQLSSNALTLPEVSSILRVASNNMQERARTKRKHTSFKLNQQLEVVMVMVDESCRAPTVVGKLKGTYPGLTEASVRRWYQRFIDLRNNILRTGDVKEKLFGKGAEKWKLVSQ